MPLFEELVRRALASRERAEDVVKQSRRVRELALLLRNANAGRTLLLHCAWCDKLKVGDEWLDLATMGRVPITESLIRNSSHGICPECFKRVSKDCQPKRAQRDSAYAPREDE